MAALPNLIVIGAMKSGTTSLHHYLNQHPQIAMSREKELLFFVEEYNWQRGVAWYKAQFRGRAAVHGESSPGYTHHPVFRGVPQRMHRVVPHARLIYILRDPIERTVSHYVHRFAAGDEHRTLDELLLCLDDNLYISRSQYYRQLEQYFPFYPHEQIFITTQERLNQQRRSVLGAIFRYLNVDALENSLSFNVVKHETRKKRRKNAAGLALARRLKPAFRRLPTPVRSKLDEILFFPLSAPIPRPILSPEQRLRLADYLRPDVERLRCYTRDDFPEWSL